MFCCHTLNSAHVYLRSCKCPVSLAWCMMKSLVPVCAWNHETHVIYPSGAYFALRQFGFWIQMVLGVRTGIRVDSGWRCLTLGWQVALIPLFLVSSRTGTVLGPHFYNRIQSMVLPLYTPPQKNNNNFMVLCYIPLYVCDTPKY